MLTKSKMLRRLQKPNKRCIVTVVLLPSGAVEVIANYEKLDEKAEYLMGAYDSNCRLKTMQSIILLDIIVIAQKDIDEHDELEIASYTEGGIKVKTKEPSFIEKKNLVPKGGALSCKELTDPLVIDAEEHLLGYDVKKGTDY